MGTHQGIHVFPGPTSSYSGPCHPCRGRIRLVHMKEFIVAVIVVVKDVVIGTSFVWVPVVLLWSCLAG